jgi:hypothetical protein
MVRRGRHLGAAEQFPVLPVLRDVGVYDVKPLDQRGERVGRVIDAGANWDPLTSIDGKYVATTTYDTLGFWLNTTWGSTP